MSELKFWVLGCKVCGHYHRGDVVREERYVTYAMTANIECPDNPGEKGYYGVSDWLRLTAAEVCELEELGKYSADS